MSARGMERDSGSGKAGFEPGTADMHDLSGNPTVRKGDALAVPRLLRMAFRGGQEDRYGQDKVERHCLVAPSGSGSPYWIGEHL